MKLRTNNVDVWTFCRQEDGPRYLMLQTSQEKANKWFFGSRFWQVTGGFVEEDEATPAAIRRLLGAYGLEPKAAWAAEHVYSFYSTRRENLEIVPVFAAEIESPHDIVLSWEHAEFGWFTAEECLERLKFRGLIDGLASVRRFISEVDKPHGAFQIL